MVDERSEIAGSFMGIPQNHVGMRTDVLDGCPKVQGMMLLMRSMAPSVVAVDEIGGSEDLRALLQVLQCGSSVVATMHGDSMEDVEERIFDRYLFLEKRKGVCGIRRFLIRAESGFIWQRRRDYAAVSGLHTGHKRMCRICGKSVQG